MGKSAKVSPELPPAVKGSTQPPSGQQASSSSPATTSTPSKSFFSIKSKPKPEVPGPSSSKTVIPGKSKPRPDSAGVSSSKKPFPWSTSKTEQPEPPETNAIPPKTGLTYADGKITNVPTMTRAETPPPPHVRSRPATAPPRLPERRIRTPVRVAPAPEAPPSRPPTPTPPPREPRRCNILKWCLLIWKILGLIILFVAMVLGYVGHFGSQWTMIIGKENGSRVCKLANGRLHPIPQDLVINDDPNGKSGRGWLEDTADHFTQQIKDVAIQSTIVAVMESLKRLPWGLGVVPAFLDGLRRQWNLRMDSQQAQDPIRHPTPPPYHPPDMPVLRENCPVEAIPLEITFLAIMTVAFFAALVMTILEAVALALNRVWVTKFWDSVFCFFVGLLVITAGSMMLTSAFLIDDFFNGLAEVYPAALELIYPTLEDAAARSGNTTLGEPFLAFLPFLGPLATNDLSPVLTKFVMNEDAALIREMLQFSLKLAAGSVAIVGGGYFIILGVFLCSARYYYYYH